MELEGLVYLAMIFAVGEMIAIPVFYLIRKGVERPEHFERVPLVNMETVKGFMERATLAIGLFAGYPQVLTAFAAVKLANRLSTEDEGDFARHYFVIGNLFSTLLAIAYVVVTRLLTETT